MKVTLKHLYGNWEAVNKLAMVELPAATAYRINLFLKDGLKHYEEIEKQREALVVKYGETDKTGNSRVTSDKMTDFSREFNELLDTQEEMYDPKLTIEALGDAKVSAATLFGLNWLIQQ